MSGIIRSPGRQPAAGDLAERQGDRRLQLDQRHGLCARRAAMIMMAGRRLGCTGWGWDEIGRASWRWKITTLGAETMARHRRAAAYHHASRRQSAMRSRAQRRQRDWRDRRVDDINDMQAVTDGRDGLSAAHDLARQAFLRRPGVSDAGARAPQSGCAAARPTCCSVEFEGQRATGVTLRNKDRHA